MNLEEALKLRGENYKYAFLSNGRKGYEMLLELFSLGKSVVECQVDKNMLPAKCLSMLEKTELYKYIEVAKYMPGDQCFIANIVQITFKQGE